MRIKTIFLAVLAAGMSSCVSVSQQRPPTNDVYVVKATAAFTDDVTCDKSTSDLNVPPEICRIDVGVTIASDGTCTIKVAPSVSAKKNHKIVEWVIKTDPSDTTHTVGFENFPNISPILLSEPKGFEYTKRLGARRFIAVTRSKSSSYYYVLIQWQSTTAGSPVNFCQADPIINNDQPDAD